MKGLSTELKVGIFAIIVIFVLSFMTFKVGGLPLIWEEGYRVHVELNDVSGLDEKSRIKIAGVDAGIVDKIWLEDGKAKLTLLLEPEIKVYDNAEVSLRMSGLLGDRHLALDPGTPDHPVLKDGDTIATIMPAADIDVLANELTAAASYVAELTENLNSIFGEEEKNAIREAIFNLRSVSEDLKNISEENRVPVRDLIAQLEVFSRSLAEHGPETVEDISNIASNLEENIPDLIARLDQAAEGLREIIVENRESVNQSMENIRSASEATSKIMQGIEKGEGTLGKLVKEDKLYNSIDKIATEAGKALDFAGRIRTFMDFSSEYNTGENEWKGYFNLTLQPSEDKYYILGIVDDEKGAVTTTTTVRNGVTTIEKETQSRIEFSAQIARRFNDFSLRVGMLENTFGMGSDIFFYDDRLKLKFDIWDFSTRETDAENAHAKVGVDYRIFKYVLLKGGVDNFFNKERRGIYLGAGFMFEDKDFKYLLGNTPSIPVQ